MSFRTKPRAAMVHTRRLLRPARTYVDWMSSRRDGADLSVFHEYVPPPSGGGHQFIRALSRELAAPRARRSNRTASRVRRRRASSTRSTSTRAGCAVSRASDVRMVHRVDGPIGVYRGFDDGTDGVILELNRAFADATVVSVSVQPREARGARARLREPGPDPERGRPGDLSSPERAEPSAGRRLRIIATSWSDNPRKGTDVLAWLDGHLDPTSRGDVRGPNRCAVRDGSGLGPCRRSELAELLREHDVYLAASRDDPVLERAARSARVRLAGGVSAERRPSRARRRGRDRLRDAGGAPRSPRSGSRTRARRAPCRDPRARARRGGGPLPRGAARMIGVLAGGAVPRSAYVAARTARWPDASRLFVVGDGMRLVDRRRRAG